MKLSLKTLLFPVEEEQQGEALPFLSAKECLVLSLLLNSGKKLYGLEMVSRSNGKLKRGTVYVTLGRMEMKGYIESEKEELPPHKKGIPRRLYQVTGYGQRVFEAWELANRHYTSLLSSR